MLTKHLIIARNRPAQEFGCKIPCLVVAPEAQAD